ncbi:uridine kinase [[Candida] railenensis]|uniref:Uridine kinase n=1 Tax=[Candida] railenensis TaxID=45579 RepID=A0A9P0QW07_9ASCO|nr:uridine kinase [[Candida] railenensis]
MVTHKGHRIHPDDENTSFFSPSPVPSFSGSGIQSRDNIHLASSLSLNDSSKLTRSNSVATNADIPSYTPPWTTPYIIGVAGYSGSGKTSISQRIIQELNQPWTILLSFDNFYNPLNKEQRQQAFDCEFDFDEPASLDFDLLCECVSSLKAGNKTEIPNYSFVDHNRTGKSSTIYGANVIIIEGIYALYDQRLLDMMDVKIFVDTDLDICLGRRLSRDILDRGRELMGAIKQWEKFVKPNAVRYVMHTMNNADLVIPRGMDNIVGINMMIKHIQNQLSLKSELHLEHLQRLGLTHDLNLSKKENIKILPSTNHTNGVNSILLSKDTDRTDFIFYFDIIAFKIIEHALEFLTEFEENIPISTYGNYTYNGMKSKDEIIAVNIIRSGDCFMSSVKKTFPEIAIGKLLIQSDSMTGEPQLHTESLPKSIKNVSKTGRKIFLFDAQIISGAASIMAIQVLVDYGISVKDIILCSYLSTEIGIRRIIHAFPDVKLVLGKVSSMNSSQEEGLVRGEVVDKIDGYNLEGFKDTDWVFSNRYIDSLYFGTD